MPRSAVRPRDPCPFFGEIDLARDPPCQNLRSFRRVETDNCSRDIALLVSHVELRVARDAEDATRFRRVVIVSPGNCDEVVRQRYDRIDL